MDLFNFSDRRLMKFTEESDPIKDMGNWTKSSEVVEIL